jgi:hypothetical protein
MKRLLLAFLALVLAVPAGAVAPSRINGSYLVGVPCTLADGTAFLCPVTIPSDTSGAALGTTTNPIVTAPGASTGGGASVSSKIVANNTTSVAIKASAGTLYGITVFNNSATIAYLKLYDAAQGSTTCGSGTPVQRIMIPASTSGAGAVIPYPMGVAYATAITSCVTTGFADNDASAPAASTYLLNFIYK